MYLLDRTCNELNYTTFNLSRFSFLEELILGNFSFYYVDIFLIDGLNHLESLVIGMNSFSKELDMFTDYSSRLFHLLNCVELKSIEIGSRSFIDFGLFELKSLPKLSTIKIGEIGANSLNFCWSSFEIDG